jgi:hypothetical protein
MAAGDITLYREATGTEAYTSTTPSAWAWDTLVNEDSAVTLDTGSTSSIFTVNEDGNYLISYNVVWRTSSPGSGSVLATKHRVDVNGTDSRYMYSESFVLSTGGATRGYDSATGILSLSRGDEVKIERNRTDTSTRVSAERVAASSGVFFLRMRDDWPVFRAYRSSNSATITSTAVDLEWNAQDEVGSHFRHSTSTDPGIITLTHENRHYMISVNVICARSQASTTHVNPFLTMFADDGAGGTFVPVARPPMASYMHNGSGCNESSVNFVTIWAPPVPNQRIKFQVRNLSDGTGTNDWVALANQTAISIVSWPEPGDPEANDTQYVSAYEASGGQAADADAYLGMDTTEESSDFFSHPSVFSSSDDSKIGVTTPGWYLFLGGAHSSRSGGSTTPLAHRFAWSGSTVFATYGQFGRQDRGDGISGGNNPDTGASGALLVSLPISGIEIQLFHLEDSSGTDTNCNFRADGGIAVQGVRLAGLFPGHSRNR